MEWTKEQMEETYQQVVKKAVTDEEFRKELLANPNEAIGKVAGISAEGENALSKALEGFTGVSLKPIVLLGTQVVSGTNYMFLCRGAATTADPVMNLYVTTVYEDTAGKCTITDNQVFDLVHYVTAE